MVERDIIDFHTAEKLGGIFLKTNAFGLMILVGCAFVAGGLFLFTKSYDERVAKLLSDNEALNDAIYKLRAFDQSVNLIFPADNPPNPNNVRCSGYVLKKDENEERRVENAQFLPGPGGVQATFRELKEGDHIRVRAAEEKGEGKGRKWASRSVLCGIGQLDMELSQ